MPRSKGILLVGALVLAAGWWGATRASEVTIRSIVTEPTNFDQQSIIVIGTVADLNETTSNAGNDYTTFQLEDAGGNTVKIFIWGHPDVRDGERVHVDGEFEAVHHAGRYTFYNELIADRVAPTQ
jgi:hypothetical protein